SRRRHTRSKRDWSSDVCSSDLERRPNQNFLTEENIIKIVDAYKDRKDIDKFTYLASFEEIKENDFNLNIPRYVDTFEEEPPVDRSEERRVGKECRTRGARNEET